MHMDKNLERDLVIFFRELPKVRVLKENSASDNSILHFFIAIPKSFIEKSETLKKYISAHISQHNKNLNELSDISVNYIVNDPSHMYLWLGKVSRKDPLFIPRMNYLEKNFVNYLSELWIGEPFNKDEDFRYKNEVRLEELKLSALNVKDIIKAKVSKNAPIVGKKIAGIGKKVGNKIGKKLFGKS